MKIKRIGISIGAAIILLGATFVFSEPGSQSDPLVTSGYVDGQIEKLKSYIDVKLGETNGNSNKESSWRVIEKISAGKSIIFDAGTEIILRAGSGKTISTITGGIDNGLADVTDGKDLKMGENIPMNHLLINPRAGGRGIYCTSDSYFLVRGNYIEMWVDEPFIKEY